MATPLSNPTLANTGGIANGDGASVAFQNTGTTAQQIYGGLGWGPYSDLVRSAGVLISSSNCDNYNSFGAYIQSNVPAGSSGNASNFFGVAVANVDNAAVWGFNTIGTDNSISQPLATSGRQVLGSEIDFNIYSNNSQTIVNGCCVIAAFWYSQPQSAAAYLVSISGGVGVWISGYVTEPGSCINGLVLGQVTATGLSDSQKLLFTVTDAANTIHNVVLYGTCIGSQPALRAAAPIVADAYYAGSNQGLSATISIPGGKTLVFTNGLLTGVT